jgi:hypothetical protein
VNVYSFSVCADATYTELVNQMAATIPTLSNLHESSTTGLTAAKCYGTLPAS